MSMKKDKIRKLKGKGEFDYDYLEDIIFFKTKNREYDRSIELPNTDIVIDIDKEDFIVGVQIFDASRFLKIPKTRLREVKKWELNAVAEGNRIVIRLTFLVVYRGVEIEIKPIIVEPLERELPNSEMLAVPC